MQRRARRIGLLCLLGALLVPCLPAAARALTSSAPATVSATVTSTETGRPMDPSFVGLSLEYGAVHAYTGPNPAAVNPVLIQLVRNLAPRQPVLRIGGDSTDATWWPIRGATPPRGVRYRLTPQWLASTRALARVLKAQLILGVNLAADNPWWAATEGRELLAGIGSRYVQALEIGNEPDLYGEFAWYREKRRRVFARSRRYSFSAFMTEFSRWAAVLPAAPLAGPALAKLAWMGRLRTFIADAQRLALVTLHRYPLRACTRDPASPIYPTIPRLLADDAAGDLAQKVAPYVAVAHAQSLPFRVDELNSASCAGKRRVSDTFASALWVMDTLFNLASVGVDGVNLHTLPRSAYELFTFTRTRGRWQAFVRPDYYGALAFAQAFPPGARLLQVDSPAGPVKVWATAGADGHTRVTVINKDTADAYQLTVQVPGAVDGRRATLRWLRAPGAASRTGVSLGGQSFGLRSSTGRLSGRPRSDRVVASAGAYSLTVPAASVAMLTQ